MLKSLSRTLKTVFENEDGGTGASMTNKPNIFVCQTPARALPCRASECAHHIPGHGADCLHVLPRCAHAHAFGHIWLGVSPLGRLQWCPRHWALTRHAIVVSALRLSRISTADPTELKTEQLAQVPPHPNIRSNAACGVERAESPELGRGGQCVLVHYSHRS